ncbi:hypothetical protein ACFQ0T_39985 [Kitasatospora gansuensis]
MSRLLAEAHRGGRRRPALVPGTPLLPATRLRAALADPAEPDLDVLAVQDDVTVSDRGWVSTVRSVVRARRSGAADTCCSTTSAPRRCRRSGPDATARWGGCAPTRTPG